MATKKETETFKQAALKMSRYRLRRALAEAGLDPKEVREVEVEGEDEMVSVLVTKFEEGDIDLPGLEKAAGKSLSDDDGDGGEPKRKAKKGNKKASKSKKGGRKAKAEEPDDEPDDPYSSAFDDDEEIEDEEDENEEPIDDDDDDDGIENDETDDEPPPRKAKKSSKKAKKSSDDEIETDDAVLQQLMDMQLTMAEVVDGLNDDVKNILKRLDFLTGETLLFHEIVKFAFARIWKTGTAKAMKPAFSDVIKKGKELFKKRFGSGDDE